MKKYLLLLLIPLSSCFYKEYKDPQPKYYFLKINSYSFLDKSKKPFDRNYFAGLVKPGDVHFFFDYESTFFLVPLPFEGEDITIKLRNNEEDSLIIRHENGFDELDKEIVIYIKNVSIIKHTLDSAAVIKSLSGRPDEKEINLYF